MGRNSPRLGITSARATNTAPARNPAIPTGRLLAAPRRRVSRSAIVPPRSEPPRSPTTSTPPPLFSEVVAQQGGAGRVIAGLADSQDGSSREELDIVARQPGEERGQAPDGDADGDHGLAHAPVGPDPEWDCRHRVDQQKGA